MKEILEQLDTDTLSVISCALNNYFIDNTTWAHEFDEDDPQGDEHFQEAQAAKEMADVIDEILGKRAKPCE